MKWKWNRILWNATLTTELWCAAHLCCVQAVMLHTPHDIQQPRELQVCEEQCMLLQIAAHTLSSPNPCVSLGYCPLPVPTSPPPRNQALGDMKQRPLVSKLVDFFSIMSAAFMHLKIMKNRVIGYRLSAVGVICDQELCYEWSCFGHAYARV